jgi:hypothetical protein
LNKIISKYISILISGIVLFLVKNSPWSDILHPKIWIIFAFYISLDFLLKKLNDLGLANKGEKFIEFYMGSSAIRIILVLVFFVTGILIFKEKQLLFTANVFALYLFFLIFEISTLVRKLRRF